MINKKISTTDLINLINVVKQEEAPELRKMAMSELEERLQKGETQSEARLDEKIPDSVKGI